MVVSELMSVDVLTITAQAPLQQAANEMRLAHINHLPVVDGVGGVVGVLSSFDVMRALAQGNVASSVSDVMTPQVVTARDDEPASDAAKRLKHHKISCLPVVDAGGKLVGLVTETDFVELAVQALAGHAVAARD
ncbi:MAG: CBS domain-containing protein [Myxococcaceae bacterium]